MSDNAASDDKSSENNVPVLHESKELSQTELREDLIATAVKFLQNPKVRQSPLAQRKAFLERKGLTKAEIDLAVHRSGTAGDELTPFARNTNYQDVIREQIVPAAGVVNTVAVTKWTRVKETASLAVIFGAALYAVYRFYEKYLAPIWFGKKSKADELIKSIDELRRSFSEVAAGIAELQQLLRNQQRALDDVVRVSSLQRGPEELSRIGLADVKDEVKSLKALLLHKSQFPALPTTTPVIPSWQLQHGQSDVAVKSADAASVTSQSQDNMTACEKDQSAVRQSAVDLMSDGAASPATSETAASNKVTNQATVDGLCNGQCVQTTTADKLTAE